jgi:nucleoid-associated protein YgaU
MGSVERILVVGILVVVVAILGIASLNADGSTNVPPDAAIDGGDGVGGTPLATGDRTVPPAAPRTAPPALSQVEQRRREQAAAKERQQAALNDLTGHPPAEPLDAGPALAQGKAPVRIPVPQGDPAEGDPLPGAEGSADPAIGTQRVLPALRKNGLPHPGEEMGEDTGEDTGEGSLEGAAEAPDTPVAPPQPRDETYIVKPGDTLWQIVRRTYGEGDIQRQIDLLLEANPTIDEQIQVGQKLKLPGVVPKGVITPSPIQEAATGDYELYEVLEGDTLSQIAAVQLGDESRWHEIYELNRQRIPDPNRMHVGTTLLLPPD